MYNSKILPEIQDYISRHRIISVHTHHRPDEEFLNMGLQYVLEHCYCQWMEPAPELKKDSVEEYVNKMKTNTYFRWLQRSFLELYGLELSGDNYLELDRKIREANADPDYHLKLMKETCNYEYNILDSYWAPGTNNGHPEFFKHTYRCDSFLCGYDYEKKNPDGIGPYDFAMKKEETPDFDSYIRNMEKAIREGVIKGGASTIKLAIAYFRSLDIERTTYEKASEAFLNPDATAQQIKWFSDFVVFRVIELADELGIPVCIHTGLGMLYKSNALSLRTLIDENPNVTFVLFHGGYPWTDDVLGLVHNYKNVIADFNWLPLICTSKAVEFIINALETGGAHRMCWGCDTWTSEESYGARLAMEHALGVAMTHFVNNGAFDIEYAKYAITRILYENPKEIFKIK